MPAISPSEISEKKTELIPEDVLDVFNELIALQYANGSATVYQEDVVSRLNSLGYSDQTIYQRGYLNVEEIYRDKGWKVTYDRPSYNETYKAHFIFRG